MNIEQRGIPAGFVASTEFIDAAKAQSDALGFSAQGVFVPHPIQGRTLDEINQLADAALAELIALVVEPE